MAAKIDWIPTLSVRLFKLHFWLGHSKTDGRDVYGIIEKKDLITLGFTLHWLSDESPIFALILYPKIIAYFLWMHSYAPPKT